MSPILLGLKTKYYGQRFLKMTISKDNDTINDKDTSVCHMYLLGFVACISIGDSMSCINWYLVIIPARNILKLSKISQAASASNILDNFETLLAGIITKCHYNSCYYLFITKVYPTRVYGDRSWFTDVIGASVSNV